MNKIIIITVTDNLGNKYTRNQVKFDTNYQVIYKIKKHGFLYGKDWENDYGTGFIPYHAINHIQVENTDD